MDGAEQGDRGSEGAGEQAQDVLGALPRTRPQRASPRRAAARGGTPPQGAAPVPGKRSTPRAGARAASKRAPRRAARGSSAAPALEPAPPQGYEADEQPAPGSSLSPPGALELAGSLAEVAVELLESGLSAVGRLLKAALPGHEDDSEDD